MMRLPYYDFINNQSTFQLSLNPFKKLHPKLLICNISLKFQ